MGGDGGVIASNRRYMRGAGQADATGDYARASKVHQSPSEIMSICSLTGAPLPFPKPISNNGNGTNNVTALSSNIVCCPFGKLYNKEAAIEALLRNDNETSWDVKSMKELYPVRFHLVKTNNNTYIPTCPVTGTELNGSQPCFVIVPPPLDTKKNKKDKKKNIDKDNDNKVNVVSQQAIREIGIESLQDEYGPFNNDDLIKLAPADRDIDNIKLQVEARRLKQKRDIEEKKRHKEKRKIKHNDNNDNKRNKQEMSTTKNAKPTSNKNNNIVSSIPMAKGTVQTAKCSIEKAVASNSILSSLFNESSSRNTSEKDKKDNLFAR